MEKKTIEVEGKTIDEAIEKACSEFNLPRERLKIEILSEGSSGFLGLVGAKRAKIRAAILTFDLNVEEPKEEETAMPREETREAGDEEVTREADAVPAAPFLEGLLKQMGFPFPVTQEEKEDHILLTIEGDGSGILIGKGGQTLDAIQYVVNKAVLKDGKEKKRIVLDTENYRKRREESLIELAEKLGEKVKRTKRPATMNPMNAHDRRIVHMVFQNDRQLTTKSRGEGAFRKIVIMPVRK
jgi:spoIIIJ-associated protein